MAVDGLRTPLQKECTRGHFGEDDALRVHALLERGADPNEVDGFGQSALSLLCSQSGHTGAARFLLDYGADASAQDMWGRTPLHWCADRGWLDTATLLIENGALVNVTTKNGDSPLLWASKSGHHSLVEHLLKADSDPLLRNNRDEQAADVAADDMTLVLITSVIQGMPSGDVQSSYQGSEKQELGVQPSSLPDQNGYLEDNIIKKNEEVKRPADEMSSRATLVPSVPAFSLYNRQTLPASAGHKKLKITLKKK